MSSDNPLPPARVEQVDRICAAYLHECIFGTEGEDARIGYARLLSGERDSEFMIQELARHRQAGIAEGLERAAKVADEAATGWINGDAKTTYGQAYQNACLNIAASIRSLSDEVAS